MNAIKTVGDMRACLAGLPDDAILHPASTHYVWPRPGLYVVRIAAGTCNAAYAEVHVAPGPSRFGSVSVPITVTP